MTRMSRSALVALFAVMLLVAGSAFAVPMKGKPAPEIKVGSWLNPEKGVTLEGLRGKVVVLDFWAPWSARAAQTIEHLNKLHETFAKKGVAIVGICKEPQAAVKAFMEKTGMKYAVGAEAEQSFTFYGVQGVPMMFLIDPEGVVQWEGHSLKELDEAMAAQVAAMPAVPAETVAPKVEGSETKPAEGKAADAKDATAGAKETAAVATTGDQKPEEKEEKADEVFVLADRGWRDPFTDPREKGESRVVEDQPPEQVGEEVQKIWENARDSLVLEGIMGWEDDLKAVIGGVTVRPGDTLAADKLKFKVEMVTRDNVEFRCINEEVKYKKLRNLTVKKTIGM